VVSLNLLVQGDKEKEDNSLCGMKKRMSWGKGKKKKDLFVFTFLLYHPIKEGEGKGKTEGCLTATKFYRGTELVAREEGRLHLVHVHCQIEGEGGKNKKKKSSKLACSCPRKLREGGEEKPIKSSLKQQKETLKKKKRKGRTVLTIGCIYF